MMRALIAIFPLLAIGPAQADFGHAEDPAMRLLFSQLDRDADGYLSKAEIEGRPANTPWLETARYGGFELADVNRDGHLDSVEFLHFEEPLPVE